MSDKFKAEDLFDLLPKVVERQTVPMSEWVAGYTRGPWKCERYTGPGSMYWLIQSGNEFTPVGSIGPDTVAGVLANGCSEANARLIAAAPELLKALKRLRNWHVGEYQSNAQIDAEVDAAIAKAEGR